MLLHKRRITGTLCILTNLIGCAFCAHADEGGFYKDKTVTMVVGFPAGGGNDIYSRLLARHLNKYIPGNPNIIVQNMPGAGSLISVRSLNTTSPRDGTVMANFQSGLITESIVTPDKVRIDFRDFNWIGVITGEYRVCYGFGANGVKSWDDMMHRKQFVLGTTAKGNADYINAATMRVVFGAPIKQVLGYKGSPEQQLAIERGELDGDCGTFSSIPSAWIHDKKIHPFVRFIESRPPEIPASATYIGDFAKNEEQRRLLDFLGAADELGRTFIMSKQVPAQRVQIMRDAFNKTMKDKDFMAEAKQQQLPVNPLTGEQSAKIVASMLSASPEVVAEARAIYE